MRTIILYINTLEAAFWRRRKTPGTIEPVELLGGEERGAPKKDWLGAWDDFRHWLIRAA
jgi:hypothetical protein